MKTLSLLVTCLLCLSNTARAQVHISWVDTVRGDFSFTEKWEYPENVELKADGRPGCADGGFCPTDCYGMMDSNGIVLPQYARQFYKLLDTTHQYYSLYVMFAEPGPPEWAGRNYMDAVYSKNKKHVSAYSICNVATHSSLQFEFENDSCRVYLKLNSIMPDADTVMQGRAIVAIDKTLWEKGIFKAAFKVMFGEIMGTGYVYTKISRLKKFKV